MFVNISLVFGECNCFMATLRANQSSEISQINEMFLWFVKILLDKNVTQCAIKPEEFCVFASVSTSLLRGMILSFKISCST